MKNGVKYLSYIIFSIFLALQSHAGIIDSQEHKHAEKLFESNPKLRQFTFEFFDLETTARCYVAITFVVGLDMAGKLPLESSEIFGYALLYKAVEISYLHHIILGKEKNLKKTIEIFEKRPDKIPDTLYCLNSVRTVLNALN